MATTGPFYDTMPGPERRDTLNEMWGIWEEAISTLIKGDAGWSPLMRSVQEGDRVVLEVYDWTGGQGTKPTQTGFLGSTGFVATAALAIDIRGPQGLQGIQGEKGDTGLTGDKGDAATISIGTVTTSLPGTTVEVVNSGTTYAAVFDFSIPQGEKGDTGSSGTISVGTTTTAPEGSAASVTNTGTASDAILNFSIPKGDKGDVGTAATIAVGTVTTGAPGTSVVVTNSGTSEAAVFDFTIPRGEDGSGSGDMTKAVYDSVDDGVVNAARAAPWTGITGKPVVISAGATSADARAVIDAVSSGELATGLNGKVDKVAGKGLSTEDFTTSEKSKLASVEDGANAYTHPANHPASIITQDANNRFVTDAEKAAWNAKGAGDVTLAGVQTLTNKTIEAGVFTNGYTEETVAANTATAYTINLSNGSVQVLTLTGNCTYTFPAPAAGKSFTLIQKQDATGSRTVTWPASVKWPGGIVPTITSAANKVDKFIFTAIDGSSWLGSVAGLNYTA